MGGLKAGDAAAVGRALRTSPVYHRRLVDLALEAVLSEQLAPEVCLGVDPATPLEPRPDRLDHAVLFAAAPLFSHEFYPLVADALVRDSARYGHGRFNIWGAGLDWLDAQGCLRRVVFLDFDRDVLCERDLSAPLRPDSVQFVCLGGDEQRLHARWSDRYACHQVNPYAAAALADDKAATMDLWAQRGVPVPSYCKVGPGERSAVQAFWAHHPEMVVKPNRATEGRGVAYFDPLQEGAQEALEIHLEAYWQEGDILLQERSDGVLYRDPASGGLHTVALRLNVAFDGGRHWLESGCGQLGASAQAPAAAGRGGRLASWAELGAGLVRRGAAGSVDLDRQHWKCIAHLAEEAAAAFPGLLLVGLDIVLHVGDGTIDPIFLEANPRPAGLSHAGVVPGCADNPGVSQKLWDGLESLFEDGAVGDGLQGDKFTYTAGMS